MQFSKKKFLIALIFLTVILLILFRYPLLSAFQNYQLAQINCNTGNCKEKIWAHRVNSIKRYNILENQFNGFETDIYYNEEKNIFEVVHPPVNDKYEILPLESFLSNVNLEESRFWFDGRGINSTNSVKALQVLNSIRDKFPGIKNCIIELYDTKAAKEFSGNGWIVSLNIPEEFLMNDVAINKFKEEIEQIENISYFSQQAALVPKIKEHFPHKKIITWHLQFQSYFNLHALTELVNDNQIEIILINYKSKGYR